MKQSSIILKYYLKYTNKKIKINIRKIQMYNRKTVETEK